MIKVNKLGKGGVTVFGYYEETWEQKTLRGLCNFKSADRTNLMVLLSFFRYCESVNSDHDNRVGVWYISFKKKKKKKKKSIVIVTPAD